MQQRKNQGCNIWRTVRLRSWNNWQNKDRGEAARKNWQSLKVSRSLKHRSKTLCSIYWVTSCFRVKLLPSLLKYVYLGYNDTFPVIILSYLNAKQEKKLVDVLGKYKKAIGWTMEDIKRISPSICMHKILLEDCSVEQQRRLNPIIKEIVKKEIIK